MSENKQNTQSTKTNRLIMQLQNQLEELLSREPTSEELKLLNYISQSILLNNTFIGKNQNIPIIHDLTEEYSCILKSEAIALNNESEPEKESIKCLSKLSNKITKENAKPLAFCNVFQLGSIKPKKSKFLLQGLVSGSSNISNTLGIPTIKTKAFFNQCNGQQYFHSVSAGLINKKSSEKKNQKMIGESVFLIGKILTEASEKNKNKKQNFPLSTSFTAHHIKYLHEALHEFTTVYPSTPVELIEDGGILFSLIKLMNKYDAGFAVDFFELNGLKNFSTDLEWFFAENQAAVLIVTNQERELLEASWKWELDCIELGKLSNENTLKITSKGNTVIDLPINLLLDKIKIPELSYPEEDTKKAIQKIDINSVPYPEKLKDVAWFLIKHPNISSKKCIHEQYNSMVGGATMNTNFPSDVEIVNLKGTNKALALNISSHQEIMEIDPEISIKYSIAELVRKMVCSGAKPLGTIASLTSSKNIATEKTKERTKLLKELENSAQKFKLSLETEKSYFTGNTIHEESGICQSVSLGMLGVINDKNQHMTMSFKDKGNIIFIIGQSKEDVSCSEYLRSYHKIKGPYLPDIDMDMERKIQLAIIDLISKKYIRSAHNIGKGGLFIALTESAMVHGFGFDIITDTDIRTDAFLYGESPGRVLVSVNPHKEDKFIDFMMQKDIPFLALGHVTKGEMRIDDISFGFIEDAKDEYNYALKKILNP